MKDATVVEAAKLRAEARFKKQREMADGAEEGRRAAESLRQAEADKTVRLKALRLAREQAEALVPAPAPAKKRAARTAKAASTA